LPGQRHRAQRLAARQRIDLHLGADAGAPQHVAQVAEQAIGDVDRARRDPAQCEAERTRGCGCSIATRTRSNTAPSSATVPRKSFQRQPRVAERAADVELVADRVRPSAAVPARSALRRTR
jgi:hypothetical protein